MNKVVKFKLIGLLSSRLLSFLTVFLILLLNFETIFRSGVLLSGGASFNAGLKYELLLNNYNLVATFYGLIFAIYLGSSLIGPDLQTGGMYVILASYPSRAGYLLGSFIACLIYMSAVQLFMFADIMALFFAFNVNFVLAEALMSFAYNYMNMLVLLAVTGLGSVFIKGNGSFIVGLLGYVYYNIYTSNTVPLLESRFPFDVAKYKDVLCLFCPIAWYVPPSYSDPGVIEAYTAKPFIPMLIYQVLFVCLIVFVSAVCFRRRDL